MIGRNQVQPYPYPRLRVLAALTGIHLLLPVLKAIETDAIAREVSLFAGDLESVAVADTITREFSIFAGNLDPVTIESADGREFSIFVPHGEELAAQDAASREFSILVAEPDIVTFPDIVGREFSIQVPAPPIIILAETTLDYVEGDGIVAIDDSGSVVDPDSVHFGGGFLQVELLEGHATGDRLGIRNNAQKEGAIALGEENEVLFGEEVIGTNSGGTNGAPLVISLNLNATLAAAEALVQSITFTNTVRFPEGGIRLVGFVMSDGDSGLGPVTTREILVTAINHPPIAGPDFLGAEQDAPLIFSEAKLLANDSDPDGDPLVLAFADESTHQGGQVALKDGTVTYTPPAGFTGTDRFEYALSDPYGGVDTGQVVVFIRASDDPSVSVLKITMSEEGSLALLIIGLPDRSYDVLASEDLITWTAIGTTTADGTGEMEFADAQAKIFDRRFYTFTFTAP